MELRPSLRVLLLFPASWSLAESMSDTESRDDGTARISTGIAGLDDILCGGLDRDRLYLIEGTPGTGKTNPRPTVSAGGVEEGRNGSLCHIIRERKRTSGSSCPPRLVA